MKCFCGREGTTEMPDGSKLCDLCHANIMRATQANLKEAERRMDYGRASKKVVRPETEEG